MNRPRTVGPLALLALGINGIVGVGIFFAPSALALLAGRRGSIVVVVAVAFALLPVAATYAILGRRFQEDGGPVTFARAAFGERMAFAIGWLAYVSAVFSTSAVVSGMATALVAKPWVALTGVGIAVGLALVAAWGIEVSKRTWSVVTLVKLAPLLFLAALVTAQIPAIAAGDVAIPREGSTDGTIHLGRAALTACFAFQGFEVVPLVAGQTRAPGRSVPLAIIGSLAFAAFLYALLQLGFVTLAPSLASDAPLVDLGAALGGVRLGDVLRVGTSVSALGITFGMIVTTPRYLAAVAHGSRLGAMNDRGVPLTALAVTTLLLVILLPLTTLGELFTLSSLSVVIQYAVVACSLAKLAFRRGRGLSRWHLLPAVATLGLAALLLVVPTRKEWISLAILAALGLVVRRKLGPSAPPPLSPSSGG